MSIASYRLRSCRADEIDRVLAIEDAAGKLFGEAGIDPDLPGLPRSLVMLAQTDGRLTVAVDAHDQPVGFALWLRYPDALHLRELDVDPRHMRRGLGRRLVDHVAAVARAEGLAHVTLTTFTDPPWNAPLYRRLGFSDLAAPPAWLQAIRDEEDRGPLAAWPRLAMALRVRT